MERDCPVFTPSLGVEALHQYAEQNQTELDNLSEYKSMGDAALS